MWLEKKLENGEIAEEQIIVIYNKNHNIEFIGKAGFAPIALWDEVKTVETVGNELRINEEATRTVAESTEETIVKEAAIEETTVEETFIEMRRNFKNKSGFTRVVMRETHFGKIKYKYSLCYPADEEGKFVEYVQNTYEMTKDEANKMYLKLKKQRFENIT